VDLTQAVGRFAILGSGFGEFPCANETWAIQVTGSNGKFAGGKSASATSSFACGLVFCSNTYDTSKIKLSK
jgi:hypothetical protein